MSNIFRFSWIVFLITTIGLELPYSKVEVYHWPRSPLSPQQPSYRNFQRTSCSCSPRENFIFSRGYSMRGKVGSQRVRVRFLVSFRHPVIWWACDRRSPRRRNVEERRGVPRRSQRARRLNFVEARGRGRPVSGVETSEGYRCRAADVIFFLFLPFFSVSSRSCFLSASS